MNAKPAGSHASGISWVDRLGAAGSALCALHCLAAPLVLALLPSITATAWFGASVEWGFVLFVSVVGLASVLLAWRTHQRHHVPVTMVAGLAALWAGLLVPQLHHALVPHVIAMGVGGALVASAHLANLRASRAHQTGICCIPEAPRSR